MPMTQARTEWPNGWPSVRSRARDRAESTSDIWTAVAEAGVVPSDPPGEVVGLGPGVHEQHGVQPAAGRVEQPLPQGHEHELPALHRGSSLPIVADESVRTSADVAALADRVDGVNLKLMKCGGLDEALRIIHTARAHGLSVMIGCMGESSLAIGAGAQLAPFVDHLDLDSHLNLLDDPFDGPTFTDGVVRPSDRPGLGVRWTGADA